MRDLQIANVHYRSVIQQNVDIDGSRAFRDGSFAPQSPFHAFNRMQHLQREQTCLRFRHQVQKLRLVAKILRLSLVHAGDAKDQDFDSLQEFQRVVEVPPAVANVRPE